MHLLTLEPWSDEVVDGVLVRLEHYFEKGEDAVLSQPAKVDLANAFVDFKLDEFVEMTLGGNRVKATTRRLKWRSKDGERVGGDPRVDAESAKRSVDGSFVVTLQPMQIRTFVAKKVSR